MASTNFSYTIPDKILSVSQLTNYTQEQAISALNQAYDKYVGDLEKQRDQLRAKNPDKTREVDIAFSDAMQQLGHKKNAEYESIRSYFLQARNGSGSNENGADPNGENRRNGQIGKEDNNNRISVTGVPNRTKELRSSPGYTNYVVSTGKNVDGTIADSSVYKRYYSDISAELYINGEWFQDINTISWQVSRQQYPLFGYNSYIFDDLALGTRIIQGQFVVNFTEPDIMRDIITKGARAGSAVGNGTTFEEFSSAAHSHTVAIDGQNATYKSNLVRDAIWRPRFDIDIMFGEKEQMGGKEYLPRHIILWDCNLSSSGIGTSANGGVLVEQYTFIARDFRVIS